MRKTKFLLVAVLLLVAGWGAQTLAKPPGGGGTQSCKWAVCASCPEGYVLAPQVWPDCCVCVPAP